MRFIEWLCVAFFIVCGVTGIYWIAESLFQLASWSMPERVEWPAWVQAIGSIGAIGATVFVLNRQNKHALRLIGETESREIYRKTAAIAAITDRVADEVLSICDQMRSPNMAPGVVRMVDKQGLLEESIRIMVAIPVHELGSYELAAGVQQLLAAVRDLHRMIKDLATTSDAVQRTMVPAAVTQTFGGSAFEAREAIHRAITKLNQRAQWSVR